MPPLAETDLSTLVYENPQTASFETFDENNKWKDPTVPTGFVSGEWATNAMTEAIAFDFNVSYAYRVEIQVETKNTNGITIAYTLPTATAKNYRISNNTENFTSADTLKPGDTAKIIFYIALIDNTIEIDAENISSSFTFAKV